MQGGVILLALVVAFAASASAIPDRLFCYHASWATYHPSKGKVDVEDLVIDDVCTHLIYAFVGLNYDGTIKILDPWNDIDLDSLGRFARLKNSHPVKVIVGIGGWNEGSAGFSAVANDPALRGNFVNSVTNFLNEWNLDGFDLDWEYPAENGGNPYDNENFVTLCKELKQRFDQVGKGWTLSAAVGARRSLHFTSYIVAEINKWIDFIGVMTYDFHSNLDGSTGHNAPLPGVQECIQGWIDDGADPSKIIIGIPTYGHSYTLADANNNGVGATSYGGGEGGPYTVNWGTLGYSEICEYVQYQGWTRVWDDANKVPYAYRGNQWVGYDDIDSVTIKTQYAISKGLGGAMIWSFDTDDVRNSCGAGAIPLLKAIRNTLRNS